MIHGRWVAACLALALAHISGDLNQRAVQTHTGLGGPSGWRATGLFFVAVALMVVAVG